MVMIMSIIYSKCTSIVSIMVIIDGLNTCIFRCLHLNFCKCNFVNIEFGNDFGNDTLGCTRISWVCQTFGKSPRNGPDIISYA